MRLFAALGRWEKAARVAAVGLAVVLATAGCGNKKRGLTGIGTGLPPGELPDACAFVQEGCPCSEEGVTLACGTVKEKVSNYVICREGVRTCSSGVWGGCVADREEKRPISYRAPMQGGYTTLGLGSSASCQNLCDPGCQETDDDGDGLVVDPDLSAGPDGVTLPPQSAGGNCEDVSVTPDTATITITSITSGAIVATPNNGKVDFDATCSGGAAVEPSWTIDAYDRAVVSAHGVVAVYSGVGGPIKVKGSTATDSDTSTLTVKVVAGDTPIAAGTTTEVGKTLYPYNNTLFPLGLKAPLVQWSGGGITPTKVQVLLCYPKNTCTTFQYAKTFPTSAAPSVPEPRDGTLDTTAPAWQIPQEIWSAFDQTAAGDVGQIIIRRQAGSTKYKQLAIDVNFATDALRGTVYYTQYLRTLHTSASGQTITYSSSAYVPGQICEVGNSTHPSSTAGSQTRAIDLSSSAATNIDPFAKGGYTAGCPVCHSVSADGGTVVSGGQNWQTSGGGNALGIDAIGINAAGAPKFTGLFAAPNYSVPSTSSSESSGEDSRGFSYAAISPDGAIVLQGPTFWGSTIGTPASNNIQSPNLTGVAGAPKPYFFANTDTPNPGVGVQFATTGSLPTYTASGSGSTYTLTASAVGTLTVDGVAMSSTSYSVLVKDESGGNAKSNGIYTVSQVGNSSTAWKLRLRSDANSAGAIKPDGEVRVSDGVSNRTNVYYISSPATGTITPGSTALTFSQRVYPPMVMGSATPRTTDYATTGPLAPATVLSSGNVLTGGYAASLVIDGHTMAVGETVLVQDQSNQAQNGTYTLTTLGVGGTGAPAAASYATTAALPANTNSAGVLTGTAAAALPSIDGITPAVGDTLLVKNEAAQANNGIYSVTTLGAGGSGTPLGAARCATTAALAANGNASGVLTATNWGPLATVDGCTLAVNDRLLVKNEAAAANNGVYTVTALGTGNSTTHTAAKVATTVALPDNSNAAGVLTATAFGALPQIDGQTLAVSDRVLLMDEATAADNGIYTVTTVGTGTSATHPNARVATTAALPTNAVSGITLTASSNGALGTIDGVSLAVANRVLVKNEGTQAKNGIYVVTALGSGSSKWVLTRAGDADVTNDIVAGDQVLVTNGTTNGNRTFYVSTPASGLITIGTTAIGFAQSSKWVLTRAADTVAAGDQFPVTSGTANGGKTFYVSTPASGGITLNTTPLGFTQSSKWSLTRAADANTSVEVFPGLQVPVTSGTANGGKTYYISAPASGVITLNTTAITFSQGVAWQLTRKSPYDTAGGALDPGLQVSVSSGSANASKTFYISAPSFGTITVNTTPITFSLGTSWQLTRTTNADATGEITPGMEVSVLNGAVNAGRVFNVSSPTSGTITINTTPIAFSYGLPSMMAPVISPDGKKVAYVNGDADVGGGVAETGWRRGLTMFNFDQATMTLSSKKRLINNWDAVTIGTPVKWPFFEGDSRSLLYVETDPNEYCSSGANSGTCNTVPTDTYAGAVCTGSSGSTSVNTNLERACYQAAYGSMSPTTRGFWPGRIFSIDTSAADPSTTRRELSNLNDAEDATDADKAYQPTVLPFTAGGKRWVIFTSPRAYGNQFNQKSSGGTPTDLSCAASMLWVSALDNQTAGTTDRSHPAFFMPGQQVAKITASNHYVNERGYLVPSPCKQSGTSCSVDEECCGYNATPSPTAACRAPSGWDPATGAPAKTCATLSGTCSNKGESCATSADCCNMASCVNFACETAGSYEAATFTREYVAECPTGQLPRWMVYTYHLTTDGNSKLTFSAQTSDDLDDLDSAKVVSLGSSTGDTVKPAAAESIDLGAALDAASVSKYLTNLRILVKLEPSSDGLLAPILRDWQIRYTCEDGL